MVTFWLWIDGFEWQSGVDILISWSWRWWMMSEFMKVSRPVSILHPIRLIESVHAHIVLSENNVMAFSVTVKRGCLWGSIINIPHGTCSKMFLKLKLRSFKIFGALVTDIEEQWSMISKSWIKRKSLETIQIYWYFLMVSMIVKLNWDGDFLVMDTMDTM